MSSTRYGIPSLTRYDIPHFDLVDVGRKYGLRMLARYDIPHSDLIFILAAKILSFYGKKIGLKFLWKMENQIYCQKFEIFFWNSDFC